MESINTSHGLYLKINSIFVYEITLNTFINGKIASKKAVKLEKYLK